MTFRKISLLTGIFSALILVAGLAWMQQNETGFGFPLPTNGQTTVRLEGETGQEKAKRDAWFDLMHLAAPGTDWRTLEYQNQRNMAAIRQQALLLRGSGDQEILANGQLIGKWNERGSKNQAGSVMATTYDPETDDIWLISAGGTLFKGSLTSSKWEVINQDYKFSGDLIRFIKTDTGRRLLVIINKIVHYSDDEGKTWTASEGLATYDNNWGTRRDPIVLDDSLQTIYYLVEEWLPGPWIDDVGIYRSIDKGEHFEKVISIQDTVVEVFE